MIYELLKEKNLAKIIPTDVKLLPECKSWANLPEDIKSFFVTQANEIKDNKHFILPASLYMDFKRIGNRSEYESPYMQRRADLMTLTIAECIKADGEYLDAVINLIWAICEETSWVIPAHNNKGELPDIEYETFVDLFSAETGAVLSFVYHYLGDIIVQNAPTVKRRMEIEVENKILAPYLKYNHFWYMGLEDDDPVNNWNPWINSNIIVAFAVFEKNRERLIQAVEKTAKSIDSFIKCYHADGACDEGPGYFGAAGASLFDYLETLADITGEKINFFDNELIKNMARYIYRVYIGGGWYVNFADGSARPGAPAKLLARVGEAVGDDNLIGFANEILKSEDGANTFGTHIYRHIKSLFQKDYTGDFNPLKTHWFDGTEILIARDNEGNKSGVFISAKGGHNDESHNHNDVGHFILYSDEKPVIIDAGVETYTKKTFSPERYDIWTMQSCYHNLPTVNGFAQIAGKDKKASGASCKHENNITVLAMELKDAYPEEAGIESYIREFTFEHGKSLIVCDKYKLNKCVAPLVLNLLCANKPEISCDIINLGENIELNFDSSALTASIEAIELTDERIKMDWQRDYLYRIRLTGKKMKKENDVKLKFCKL